MRGPHGPKRSGWSQAEGSALLGVDERGADLILGHFGEALIERGELAREVIVAAQGCQKRRLGYAVAATRELEIGDLLGLDPAADRAAAHVEQGRSLRDSQELRLRAREFHGKGQDANTISITDITARVDILDI